MLHWHSYLLKPDFFWLHVTFATLIALFYYSISILLIYLLHQRRHRLVEPKAGILSLLATFTIANGTTYLINIWKIWYPNYWLANGIEAVTAIISWCTALLLVKFVATDIAQKAPDTELQSLVVSREGQEGQGDNLLCKKNETPYHPLETTTPSLAEEMNIEQLKVLQREQLEKELPKNNEIYRVLVEETARLASVPLLAPNPIVETDLEGQILYLNPEAIQLFPDLQDTGVKHPFLTELLSLVEILQQEGSLMREVKVGQAYYEQVLHFVEGMGCLRIYGFDITARRKAQEQLIYNAFYDQLTELPNRALFMDRLYQAFRRAQKYVPEELSGHPYRIAVLYLNLDRFKLVNESLGEKIGDLLLRGVAYRLQTCLRPTDTLARLGGDEFAVLLEGIDSISEATNIADAIHQTLNSPFYLENSEVFISASIGIALNTTNEPNMILTESNSNSTTASFTSTRIDCVLQPEELLRHADIAMYRAKSQGHTRYELYDTAMQRNSAYRLQLETDLRRGIEREEFQVYYQSIVSLETGKITGFEALLRWRHPQRGIVSPGEFIPIAEETGLITPISWWTLREACRQMSIWQKQFPTTQPLTINVNLSCQQFTEPDLIDKIDQILQETGLMVGSLKLEITESVVMENPDWVKDVLLQLRQRKIFLCIDDFGTGYSSLSRLHNFPISTLKIDRSFVSRIGALGENLEIVQTIVNLAQTLGMDVVAEGIEVQEQVNPLIELRCQYGQGYLFSKPLDSDAAEGLLKNNK
ncbi:MAG: EAL domain-containing protein [Symploca sp. SIO3E6]|nr:EAL domain-containing protein [Caldora sp. SIO3E6]